MPATPPHAPYSRRTFLALVPASDRALAARLCDLLEAVFPPSEIMLYRGTAMPVVVRDMEWIAGFAMRKAHPVAYCCSPAVRAAMGKELAPYLSGKSCIAVKPRRGEAIEVVLDLVDRAFREASRHGGVISKADRTRRDRLRREDSDAAEGGTTSARSSAGRRPSKDAKSTKPPKSKPSPKSTSRKKTTARSTPTVRRRAR